MSEDRNVHEEHWHHRHHGMPGLFWGLVLILLGIVFFLSSQGWLPRGDWWQYFLIGLGLIFLVDGLVRSTKKEYGHRGFGRAITGIILIFIGLAFLLGFGQWWPLILIVLGIFILVNAWTRR